MILKVPVYVEVDVPPADVARVVAAFSHSIVIEMRRHPINVRKELKDHNIPESVRDGYKILLVEQALESLRVKK